jgi:hypothetical protein
VFERFPDPAGAEHREAMTMLLDLHRRLRAGHVGPTLN